MFLTAFLSHFFFDFLDFHCGRKKLIKHGNSLPDKTKSIYATVLSSRGSITYFVALLLDEM